jgi:hypothetical protein
MRLDGSAIRGWAIPVREVPCRSSRAMPSVSLNHIAHSLASPSYRAHPAADRASRLTVRNEDVDEFCPHRSFNRKRFSFS